MVNDTIHVQDNEQRSKRTPVTHIGGVLLAMRKEDLAAVHAQQPTLKIEWCRSQRAWIYLPASKNIPFPPALLPFLPHPPTDRSSRTYLDFRGDAKQAEPLSLRWDAYVKCWWFPGGPDLLPSAVRPYRPQPFSWAAWCEQRINPSATLCQIPYAPQPLTKEAQALCNEMFRASLYGQKGFLYLRSADPKRNYDVWLAIRQMNVTHATLVVIVTTLADIPLWRSVLLFLGTQPASVVLLTYREIHLLDPRNPRDSHSPARILPNTCSPITPDVVVWDHCHLLTGGFAREQLSAASLARRSGWNVWLSGNPCTSPDELEILRPLLETRGFGAFGNNPERWLSWRSISPQKPVSAQLQQTLFDRDYRGTLGGLRAADHRDEACVLIRPIGHNKSIEPEKHDDGLRHDEKRLALALKKAAGIVDLLRTYLGEQRQVVVVCGSDEQIELISKHIGQNRTIGVLGGNQISPAELPDWLDAFRCALIHSIHLSPGPPLNFVRTPRIIISVDLPTSAAESGCLLSLSGSGSTIVIPYLTDSAESDSARAISLANSRMSFGQNLPSLPADRF